MKQLNVLLSKYSLIFIVLAIIIAVIVWTVTVPVSDTRQLRGEIEKLEVRYNTLKTKAAGEDEQKLNMDLAKASAELKEFEKIFPPEKIRQTDTYPVIQMLEQESGLKVSAMSYQPTHFDNLNQSQPTAAKSGSSNTSAATPAPAASSGGVQQPLPGKGMKMTAVTNFNAEYGQLMYFVTLLHAQEQSIGLREFQINANRTQEIVGSFTLEFYGFMPEAEEKAE